jgi:DNA repair protein RadC
MAFNQNQMNDYPIKTTIKSLAEDDRPREKMLLKGKHSLSNAELIAIMIGSGNADKNAVELAREILKGYSDKLSKLSKADVNELTRFKGIGPAKAINIIAAIELSKRRLKETGEETNKISSSKDAYDAIKPHLFDLSVEEFWVAFLNRSNKIIGLESISRGGIHGTVVDSRVIFKKALDRMASAIILFHNHPSGNLKPSAQDDAITKQIKDAGKLLDILILDHLIFSDKSFYSYADQGRMT